MNIVEYVKQNYETLPKSKFDSDECIIVLELKNENYGYGHHDYEGIGVTSDGSIVWCYSSGCSCDGSCGQDHRKEAKVLQIESQDLSKLDPADVLFDNLQVEFESY